MTKKPAHYQTLEVERIKSLVCQWTANGRKKFRVLDFGCGRGRYLDIFVKAGFEVVGVDVNVEYLRELKTRGLVVRTAEEEWALNESYDIILLSHLVEHVSPGDLFELIPRLCTKLNDEGRIILVTPILGERFYYDFSHVRPFYPQSIRHAFGQTSAPLSFGAKSCIELIDIYFFKDPLRTRKLRSFYVGSGLKKVCVNALNTIFDILWRASFGHIGISSSWLGVYRVVDRK
jgi:SAM-dependent methyltransferase